MSTDHPLAIKLLKQANIADGLILAPFAIPFVAGFYLNFWGVLNGLIGGSSFPAFDATQVIFVNLAGAFALLAVLIRAQHPSTETAFAVGVFKLAAAAIFAIGLASEAALVFAIPLIADLLMGSALVISSKAIDKNN